MKKRTIILFMALSSLSVTSKAQWTVIDPSRFIVKRIFAEEFVVIKRDPSKTQFIARLNEFYFQFQKLANNCAPVKAI